MSEIADLVALYERLFPEPMRKARIALPSPDAVRRLTANVPRQKIVIEPTVHELREAKRLTRIRAEYAALPKGTNHAKFRAFLLKLRRLHRGGRTIKKLADALGLTAPGLRYWFKKRGWSVLKHNARPTIRHGGVVFHEGTHGVYLHERRGRTSIYLHRVIWEERHGPIPAGFRVNFKTANRLDFSDRNLELVSRIEFARKLGQSNAGRKITKQKLAA